MVSLGPDIASMGLANSLEDTSNAVQPTPSLELDLTFDDIDDEELDTYIMSEHESKNKNDIWLKRNAKFLEDQKGKSLLGVYKIGKWLRLRKLSLYVTFVRFDMRRSLKLCRHCSLF